MPNFRLCTQRTISVTALSFGSFWHAVMSGEWARFCLLSAGRNKNILQLPQNTGERYYCHIVQRDDEDDGSSKGRAAVLLAVRFVNR